MGRYESFQLHGAAMLRSEYQMENDFKNKKYVVCYAIC